MATIIDEFNFDHYGAATVRRRAAALLRSLTVAALTFAES